MFDNPQLEDINSEGKGSVFSLFSNLLDFWDMFSFNAKDRNDPLCILVLKVYNRFMVVEVI